MERRKPPFWVVTSRSPDSDLDPPEHYPMTKVLEREFHESVGICERRWYQVFDATAGPRIFEVRRLDDGVLVYGLGLAEEKRCLGVRLPDAVPSWNGCGRALIVLDPNTGYPTLCLPTWLPWSRNPRTHSETGRRRVANAGRLEGAPPFTHATLAAGPWQT